MADDGMLMNFSLDTGSLPSKPIFKGGRWKDRLNAKKGLKRSSNGNPQPHGSLTGPNTLVPEKARQFGEEVGNERAAKKQKTNNGDSNAQSNDHIHTNHKPTNGDVISSLFTSNPTTTSKPILFKPSDGSDLLPIQPSNAPLPSHLHNFTSLGLSPTLSTHLLQTLSLTAPTAIQKATIPQLINDPTSDAFIQAETGSGKTLAYLLPILHHILALNPPPPSSRTPPSQPPTTSTITRKSGLFALILAPTRELTHQISSVLTTLLHKSPHIVSGTVTGGATKNHEKARLRKGLNILVATPGRLADHLENTEVLDLRSVRWLVLDEGDRLMEMGFEEEIQKIVGALGGVRAGVEGKMARLRKMGKVWGGAGPEGKVFGGRVPEERKESEVRGLPERRMTVLCSATMKMGVQRLGEMSLKDAVLIKADSSLREEDDKSKEVGEEGAPTTNGTEKANDDDDDDATNPANETLSTTPKAEEQPFQAPSQLKQSYIIVPAKQRLVTLAALLKRTFARKGSVQKAIVFVSCADSVEFLFEVFARTMGDREEDATTPKPTPSLPTITLSPFLSTPQNQISLFKIHGSLPPPLRPPTLSAFRTTTHPTILLATDIAARGLDLPNIDLVIEYDAAFSAGEHLHRVGRTARAGKGGGAVGFLLPGGEEGFVDVLKEGAGAGGGNKVKGEGAEDVLRKGFAPRSPAEQKAGEADRAGEGNWEARATEWQLDVERWVLADHRAGELARRAFTSHVRAYATHVAKERYMFDVKDLHLGHLAKAFALREKPGSMGRGGGGTGGRKDKGARRPRVIGGDATTTAADGTERPDRTDHLGASSEGQDAARKMRAKVREQMAGGASEFNIG